MSRFEDEFEARFIKLAETIQTKVETDNERLETFKKDPEVESQIKWFTEHGFNVDVTAKVAIGVTPVEDESEPAPIQSFPVIKEFINGN